MLATTHWLRQQLPLSEAVLTRLLKDRWPRIRQATLFSLTDRAIDRPALHSTLLLDNNMLIRLRAKNMLHEVMDVPEFWCHVVTSADISHSDGPLYTGWIPFMIPIF
ncbi:hypothetical protein ACLK10_11590 [Escherichia coli]